MKVLKLNNFDKLYFGYEDIARTLGISLSSARVSAARYTKQVIVRTLTLEQMMKNKIDALLDRHEIRDAFDIEFLLRSGVLLPDLANDQIVQMKQRLAGFKENDFKVKLGSILEGDLRSYYIQNRFAYFYKTLTMYSKKT